MGNEQSNFCGDEQNQLSSNQVLTQQIITPTHDQQYIPQQTYQAQQLQSHELLQTHILKNQNQSLVQQQGTQRIDILAANPLSGIFVQDISQQHLQNQLSQNSQIQLLNPVHSSRISELPNLIQNSQLQTIPLQQNLQILSQGQITQHSQQQSQQQQIIPQQQNFQVYQSPKQEQLIYSQQQFNYHQQQQQLQLQLIQQQKEEANRRACDTLNQLRTQYYQKIQLEISQIPENQTLNESLLPQLHQYFIQVKNEDGQDLIKDKYYGEVFILQHRLNPEYKLCLKVLQFQNLKEWRKAEKEYQVKQLFNHTHLVNIHILHSRKFLCVCNTTYHLCIILDHILDDLRQIDHIDIQEIWNLVDNVVDALYSFQLKGIPHESISFSQIIRSRFIDNSIVYKIIYQEGSKSNFHKAQEKISIIIQEGGFHEPLFLCPNQWNAIIQRRQTEDSHDRIRSDVFTFGMVLLHFCLDKSGQQELVTVYDQNGFQEDKLKSLLRQIKSEIPKHLFRLIEIMLKINEIERPDWISLSETLNDLAVKRIYHQHLSLTHLSIYTQEVQKQFEKRLHSSRKGEKLEMISDRLSLPFTSLKRSENQSIIPSNFSDIKQSNSRIARNKLEHQIEEEELLKDLNMNDLSTIEKRHRKQMNFPDGHYDGEVMDGKRDGLGQAHFDDGRLYDGSWKNDKPHGHGTLLSKEGVQLYKGNFFNGQFDGFGTQRNSNPIIIQDPYDYQDLTNLQDIWKFYNGDHYQGQWDGFGNLELTNGERFVGAFSEGYPHGVGVYHTTLKQCINGQWVMGDLVKKL